MSDDEEKAISTTTQSSDIELQIIEEVFEAEIDDAQILVVRHLQSLGSEYKGTKLELFLQSFWNHFEALRLVREEGDFRQAVELEGLAANGFGQLDLKDLESTSRAFSAYADAVLEAQKLNINRFLELHAAIEEYLKNAGRFGRKLQPMIDHMKPDAEFASGIQAIMVGDYSAAKILITQASEGSKRLAENYYEEGTQLHYTFLGLGQLYIAFLTYFVAQLDLNNLELDNIETNMDIPVVAKEAEKLLAQADLQNNQIRISHQLSKALIELLEVSQVLGTDLHRCLKSAFKPDTSGFSELRAKTRQAIDHLSNAGPNAAPLIRTCDQLLVRIKNFERLSKPNNADFGIYSGLISCALFLPMFIIASYANNVTGLGIDAIALLSTMVGLALIGGFGFGALKFRSFLFSRTESGEDRA